MECFCVVNYRLTIKITKNEIQVIPQVTCINCNCVVDLQVIKILNFHMHTFVLVHRMKSFFYHSPVFMTTRMQVVYIDAAYSSFTRVLCRNYLMLLLLCVIIFRLH
jgi:hypothetical protein